MKIGIDASRTFIEKRTGTEEYSYRLIKNLMLLDTSGHQIFLYVDNKDKVNFSLSENIIVKEIERNRLWTQIGLSKEIKKNPVDVLFIPAHSVSFIHPQKTVVTVHGLEFKYFPESYSLKERITLEFNTLISVKWAKKIIVPSENTKRDLIKFYKVDAEKIRVVNHGACALNRESRIKSQGIESIGHKVSNIKHQDKEIFDILFIGRLEKRKNLVNLIKAFELLKSHYIRAEHCTLTIVGKDGFGFRQIKLTINQSPYKNDIIIKGYVSEIEKEKLYQNAGLFILISFYEGFGLPILEAMSYGVPVICSNASSLAEIAGEAGLLVNPNDIEEIAEALERIICNQGLKNDIIKKGFENVKKFSWKKCAKETKEVLLNC